MEFKQKVQLFRPVPRILICFLKDILHIPPYRLDRNYSDVTSNIGVAQVYTHSAGQGLGPHRTVSEGGRSSSLQR